MRSLTLIKSDLMAADATLGMVQLRIETPGVKAGRAAFPEPEPLAGTPGRRSTQTTVGFHDTGK